MQVEKNTQQLYNNQADDWARKEPILLSDYSARPFILDLCEPLNGLKVLDIGCGEGYVSREIMKRGASEIYATDISEKMIEQANAQKASLGLTNIVYEAKDVREIETKTEQYDLVIAMFLFNYLSVKDTEETFGKIYEMLKPGGHLVLSVPHPCLAFLKQDKYPFYFTTSGGYFSGRDQLFPGQIWRRDGIPVHVQCVHKTFEDYFNALAKAGFTTLPQIKELRINEEHIALDEKFFKPLFDLPLHVGLKIQKQ